MSELEKLKNKRAELETESRSLKEEQKNLEANVMILEERIAVEDLKNGNKTIMDAISQLENKKSGLETKLKQVSQMPEASTHSEENAPEAAAAPADEKEGALEPAEAAPEEFEEDTVTVTAIDDEALVEGQEEIGENIKKQQEKKKHRLF